MPERDIESLGAMGKGGGGGQEILPPPSSPPPLAGPRPGPKLLRSSKFRSKQASITQNKQVSLKTNNYH